MSKLWIIARKDIQEALRSRSTYIYVGFLLVLSILSFSNYTSGLASIKGVEKTPAEILDYSRLFVNGATYNMPLWFAVLMCTIFATYAVILDKSKRSLESLMAAPVSLRQIWIGKALGVTLPSVVIALAGFVVAFLVLTVWKVVPVAGSVIYPDVLPLISAIILVPLLIFSMVVLVIYVQLVIANPRIANFVFTGFFVIIFFSSTLLSGQSDKINFSLIYSGIIIICAGITLILSRSLTRERVLLSNKN